MKPKIKICGMKHNVAEIVALQPDYLGFIFHKKVRGILKAPFLL